MFIAPVVHIINLFISNCLLKLRVNLIKFEDKEKARTYCSLSPMSFPSWCLSAVFFCKPKQWRPLGTIYECEGDRSSFERRREYRGTWQMICCGFRKFFSRYEQWSLSDCFGKYFCNSFDVFWQETREGNRGEKDENFRK